MTKILLIAANPKDTAGLRLNKEIREIDLAVHHSKFGSHFEFEPKVAVRLRDISEYLERFAPDIVHFSGHASESSEIILEDDDGSSHPISREALKEIFSRFKQHIRCVVLNACYSEIQANAIAEEIDCVVGMLGQIDDESAIDFSREFYRQLAMGEDITTAFKQGRAHIGQRDALARLLTYKANPSQITFIMPLRKGNLKIVFYILGLVLPTFLIYFLSIPIVNSFTKEHLSLLYGSVALSSCLGVIWGAFGVKCVVTPFLEKISGGKSI